MTASTDAPSPENDSAAEPPQTPAPRARDWVAMLAPIAAGIVAVPGSVSALEAFREGRSLLFFWGQLAALGVLAVMIVATVVLFGRILRHRGAFVTCFILGMLVMVGLAVSLHTVAFRVPPAVGGGIDVLLLLWSVIGMRRLRGAGQTGADEPSSSDDGDADTEAGTDASDGSDGSETAAAGRDVGDDAAEQAQPASEPAPELPASYPPPAPVEDDSESALQRAERHARWAVWRLRLLDWVFVILAAVGCLLTVLGY